MSWSAPSTARIQRQGEGLVPSAAGLGGGWSILASQARALLKSRRQAASWIRWAVIPWMSAKMADVGVTAASRNAGVQAWQRPTLFARRRFLSPTVPAQFLLSGSAR